MLIQILPKVSIDLKLIIASDSVYLLRGIFMEDHLKFWCSCIIEIPDRSQLLDRRTSK